MLLKNIERIYFRSVTKIVCICDKLTVSLGAKYGS